MPDPLDTGVGFASRLVQNVYGLHKQEQDQGRADAEKSRQSMMAILEGAANSGNVNPEDMPALYSKLFELSGAKSKDIATLTPHLQQVFTKPDTPRQPQMSAPETMPGQVSESGLTSTPSFELPSVPTGYVPPMSPAIRIMSPEEKAHKAAQAQLDAAQVLYPQKKKELDDANNRRLDLQGAKLTQQEQTKTAQIILKGGIDAQKKLNAYVATYQAAGYDPDAAKGLASKALIREQDAAVIAKEQQAATGKARAQYLSGQLEVHRKNADTLSRRVDIQAKALEEAAKRHRASEANAAGGGGARGAIGRNLKVLMANTKELYTALTPLNNAIVKLETDPLNKDSDGTLIPEVATQVADLKSRRDAIQTKLDTARQTWLPQMPEPTDSALPPVPQMSTRGAAATKGIIRRANLGAVRAQNPSLSGLDDNALIKHLQVNGYVVK